MKTEIEGNSAWIIPGGNIDLTNAERLKEEFEELVEDKDILHIEIDFKNVKKIDSSGLGKILLFHKIMREKGGSIQLKNVNSEYVLKVFDMVDLNQVININE